MKKDIWILGISGAGNKFHDNSACLIKNGKVLFAASEERYSRIKHDPSFPKSAIKAALTFAKIKPSDISLYATGWPRLSIVKTLFKVDKRGIALSGLNYLRNFPILGLVALLKHLDSLSIKPVSDYLPVEKHVLFDHYLAHASSAYRTSGFEECLSVVWDGFGTKSNGLLASGGVFICREGMINEVETHPLEASIGLFYEAVTNALGFVPAEGEGKTMGLAAYGNPKRFLSEMRKFAPAFREDKWITSRNWLDTLPAVDLKYKEIFDLTFMGRELARLISKSPQDVAAACQYIIEEEAVKFFEYLHNRYKLTNFATAGGVFLNVKMGKRIRELPFVKKFYVHPHAGDGGLALGAALEVYATSFSPRQSVFEMRSSALGDGFSKKEIERELLKTRGVVYALPKNLAGYVANRLRQGAVLGWFQGRAEWGPRALGQRSVLADPSKEEVKERINKYLKKREWFMPFAPSILEEKAKDFLKGSCTSPFMTMAFDATSKGKKQMKAAVHIDATVRPQTVSKRENPLYWRVISEFEKLTGVPAILNTSFNLHGLPIVNSPKDAIDHLLWGAIDGLVIGPFVVKRKENSF
ncbi:hypothetical protein A2115_01440 [Candidatus Woesebacteria bacterium GWA1_41_8]|uniref:Carbamoyltransferase n=1 Tax=Candidatus Woesebacteria bacterium GWA1_41_8 TaxID=1802471 RepID=A0A1F7WH44_9BACT|nr:MAG: hypothetical protein A2115_01440 [Candidatus Woesebacteria bacterium GWA1_41_8]